tara:strand:+ start:651 stop:1166 length:516 start_codon:yes stop_codon:yes gene_type:complete
MFKKLSVCGHAVSAEKKKQLQQFLIKFNCKTVEATAGKIVKGVEDLYTLMHEDVQGLQEQLIKKSSRKRRKIWKNTQLFKQSPDMMIERFMLINPDYKVYKPYMCPVYDCRKKYVNVTFCANCPDIVCSDYLSAKRYLGSLSTDDFTEFDYAKALCRLQTVVQEHRKLQAT